ncbi:hypothetical protein ABQF34_00745 [Mycolicibacterium boenickei]
MIRRVIAISFATALLLTVCGCDLFGKNPLKPSLPGAFGARITNGNLQIWTGSLCMGVNTIKFQFDWSENDRAELVLQTPTKSLQLNPPPGQTRDDVGPDPGVDIEYLTFGGPYPGFKIAKPLPPEFDWRKAKTLGILIDGELMAGGAEVDLTEVFDQSAHHPKDTYWFQGIGWLNPPEVRSQDGNTFLALCTPDPAKDLYPRRVYGVRVTDGALRIWPGPYCGPVDTVTLTFQPGQAALVLTADPGNSIPFENLTANGPYPGFDISRPLPDGFDWRPAKSAVLRVTKNDVTTWTTPTDLAPARTESAQHPDDTYWFQGFGWLNPTQIAEHDGKDFLTACAQAE